MRLRIRNFDGGLSVTPGEDKIPDNCLIRAQDTHRLARGAVFSRQGSTSLHLHGTTTISLGVSGLHYWDSKWFYGTCDSLYCGTTCLSSGTYNGNRLTILPAAPTAGMPEVLFIAGGSTATLRKIDSTETVSNWGISPPPETLTCASGGTAGEMTTGATYLYRYTYYNSKTGSRSNPTAGPGQTGFSANTKLLIHCDGAHASTALTDACPSAHPVYTTGNAALSTASPKFGTACLSLPGAAGDYAYCSAHADWEFGTEPFTIECWARFTDEVGKYAIAGQGAASSASWTLLVDALSSGFVSVTFRVNNAIRALKIIGTLTTDTWHHIAALRSAIGPNYWTVAWNGVFSTALYYSAAAMPSLTDNLTIGYVAAGAGGGTSSAYLKGAVDELRIIKGEAMWSGNFAPATGQYGAAYIIMSSVDKAVSLAGIAPSTDPQVTNTEIWRTAAGGSAYYLVTRVDAAASTYLDRTADADLGLDELQTDNLKPYAWFDDCITYNASMFWITRSQSGELGRLYYSPVGRSEAVQGYIDVTDDSDPLQRLVLYGTGIGVFSKSGFYEINGTNPYFSRQIHGVPGTLEPYSVCVTPHGIAYEAPDGPRLLSGAQTAPLAAGKLDAVFQGEARSNLVAWGTGTYGIYAREEYILSNIASSQTLAVNLRTGRWRQISRQLTAMHYAPTIDTIAANYLSNPHIVFDFEKEGEYADVSAPLLFSIETKHFSDSGAQRILVRSVFVDAKTASTSLAATLVYDSTTLALSSVSATSRTITEIAVGKWVREFGVRLSNSITNPVEVHGIDIDIYAPQEVSE